MKSDVPREAPKRIVYLFGAGATHAELTNLDPQLSVDQRGLLVTNVSSRVIARAHKNPQYLKGLETVSATAGSLNIELLISLIENSKVHNWATKSSHLKKLVERDIKNILNPRVTRRFVLHKALLELQRIQTDEKLIGLISLNYDDVLDQAYKAVQREQVNYCFSLSDSSSKSVPLLKLHGSFNWEDMRILSKKRTVEIIPFGSSKSYLHVPFGFIWNRALSLLVDCDVLRVIGCSLSPNDAHLIDLLFKAHLERSAAFDIEIIDREDVGTNAKKNYGFFPGIKTLLELQRRSGGGVRHQGALTPGQVPDPLIPDPNPVNPLKTWLKYKGTAAPDQRMRKTTYLKKVMS